MNKNSFEKSIIDAQVSLESIKEIKHNSLRRLIPSLAFGLGMALLTGLFTYSIANYGDKFIWTIVTIVSVIIFIVMGVHYINQCKLKGVIPIGFPVTLRARIFFIGHFIVTILLIIAARKFLNEGIIWALYAATVSNMFFSFLFSNLMPGYQWAMTGKVK